MTLTAKEISKPVSPLRRAREAHGLTLREVADATGMSVMAISSWERGVAMPSYIHALKLVRFYETSASELLSHMIEEESK